MRTRLEKIHDLLNIKSMLLQSILDRSEVRDKSRVVLTEEERQLLEIINKLKTELKGES
jgi:hypothetical protein